MSEVIKRLALVSQDYNHVRSDGHWDLSPHFPALIDRCEDAGCDTILFALYTWDIKVAGQPDGIAFFRGRRKVERIVLEAGDLWRGYQEGIEHLHSQIWEHDKRVPRIIRQLFSTSSGPAGAKAALTTDLPNRIVGDGTLLLCGESNIVYTQRSSRVVRDPLHIARRLRHSSTTWILNPVHDYMTRFEMNLKRSYLSRDGKILASVWNSGGRKGEARLPWKVFANGRDRTEAVSELPPVFANRPDIRIGIVDRKALG